MLSRRSKIISMISFKISIFVSVVYIVAKVGFNFVNFGFINRSYMYITFVDIFMWLIITINTLHKKYIRFNQEISSFNSINLEKSKNTQINDFINRLVPVHIQEILRNPDNRLAELYDDVTIVYADICGFTSYSADKSPKEVVTMLSKLFTDFDKECNELSLYKLYTIGDCYVALGNIYKGNGFPHEEARKIIEFAFKMIDIIKRVRYEIKFEELAMRIGVHIGKCIGGVIGTEIVRFDVYGRDVLTANRMESEGIKGEINISKKLKNFLENFYPGDYVYTFHKMVEVDGEEIETFIINKPMETETVLEDA